MQLEPSMVRPTPEGLSQRDTETRRNSGPPVGYTSVEMVPSDDDQIDTRVGYGDMVPPGIRHPGSLSEPGGLGRGGGMMDECLLCPEEDYLTDGDPPLAWNSWRIRFKDGYEHTAAPDELLMSRSEFQRPDYKVMK